jgi:hypothetical protein
MWMAWFSLRVETSSRPGEELVGHATNRGGVGDLGYQFLYAIPNHERALSTDHDDFFNGRVVEEIAEEPEACLGRGHEVVTGARARRK